MAAVIPAWPDRASYFHVLFFLHLCGGIRHLIWDAVYGFDLSTIYASGWLVVAASVVLTGAAWIVFTVS
jgi:succinate dehydrogenase / fumarate reductase, cytochrome b subunit